MRVFGGGLGVVADISLGLPLWALAATVPVAFWPCIPHAAAHRGNRQLKALREL